MTAFAMRAARALWHLMGKVPDVGPRHERMLFYVSLAFVWELYDLSLSMTAMSHIAAGLQVANSEEITYAHSLIRLGSVPAVFTATFMDRFGRKAVFLAAVCGLSVCTCATALVWTLPQYVACQMVCRTFVELCSASGFVLVSEELPAEHRGWGLGVLGAMGALGYGLGAVLFAGVNLLPFGWRALYGLGAAPLLLLPTLRREVPETARFIRMEAEAKHPRHPLAAFAAHRRRAAIVAAACLCFTTANVPVFQFCGYHVLRERRWQPWMLSMLVFLAGAVGVAGNIAIGRLADRAGRRPVAGAVCLGFPCAAYLFYHGEGVAALFPAWGLLTLINVSLNVLVRAMCTEIFPTYCRGTAGGLVSTCNSLGGVLGLFAVGWGLEHAVAPLADLLAAVSCLILLSGALLLYLPETSGRDLDDLHPEAGGAGHGAAPPVVLRCAEVPLSPASGPAMHRRTFSGERLWPGAA